MESIRTIEVDPTGAAAARIGALLCKAFGQPFDLPKMLLQTESAIPDPTLYLGAFAGDEIVGFATFISQRLWRDGRPVSAFQAANVATSPDYRGRGIFQSLVHQAEDLLTARGAVAIFGFPNAMAYPIWTRKLNYREIPSAKWRGFNLLGWNSVRSAPDQGPVQDAVYQDDSSLIEAKQRLHGEALVVSEAGEALVWGVRRDYRKFGLGVPFFDLGGLRLGSGSDFETALAGALRQAGNPIALRVETQFPNAFQELFPGLAPCPEAHAKLIIKDLNGSTKDCTFGLFGGVTDTF